MGGADDTGQVVLELTQQLIAFEPESRAKFEAALLLYTNHRTPLPVALRQVSADLWKQVASELARRFGQASVAQHVDPGLVQELPAGLCTRLLAYPLRLSTTTGDVEVLAVNPLDECVVTEFAQHLKRPVTVLRGELDDVLRTVGALDTEPGPNTERQDGQKMNSDAPPSANKFDSLPPIPLVRRPPVVPAAPRTARGVAPPARASAPGGVQVVVPRPHELGENQTLDFSGHVAVGDMLPIVSDVSIKDAPASSPMAEEGDPAMMLSRPSPDELERALTELADAGSAVQVVAALTLGMSSLCEEVIVFSVRAKTLSSRARLNYAGQVERFGDLEVPITSDCSVTAALGQGQYLDPPTPDDLLLFVGQPAEVCATRVTVQGRPVLVFAAGGFSDTFEVSRRADRLARAAADALGRIVRARKQ